MYIRKSLTDHGNIVKRLLTLTAFLPLFTALAFAAPQTASPLPDTPANTDQYLLAAGDLLEISVWKEEGMQQQQILVAPDGNINFPLAGAVMAAGKSIAAIERTIADRLSDYIADPVITVKLLQSAGNTIFVIGKVNKPGQFPANRRIDVLQALSLAG